MKLEKRKEIAKRFLQTVLWVDDEITMDVNTEGQFKEFFWPASNAISREGMLCQLCPFTPSNGAGDPYADSTEIDTIKELVRRADVTIVDWHLGTDNPANAVQIVNEILSGSGTRFCVLLSQALNLEDEFTKEFSEKITGRGSYWSNDEGKFFILFQKSEFAGIKIPELIQRIIGAIADTYSDYLHWIAMEIMANIKQRIPTLLAHLPKDTDRALMAEHLSKDLKSTLDFAVSAIGEDVLDIVTEMRLESVETAADQLEADAQYIQFKANFEIEAKQGISKQAQIVRGKKPVVPDEDSAAAKEKLEKLLGLCPSYNNLHRLFEQKSLAKIAPQRIYQGAVYRKVGAPRNILICISQACDCDNKDFVLLLEGRLDAKLKKTQLGRTTVMFDQKNYVVLPDAEASSSGKVLDPEALRNGIEGLEYVGGLRASVAMRIADRYFTYQTRVGVNQPAIIRELRQNS